MKRPPKKPSSRMRLQELCRLLDVPYRDARYVCEKGWLPHGVSREPGRGNHRYLTPRQAIWLGVVLKLKYSGLKTHLAVRIAKFAELFKTERSFARGWWISSLDGVYGTRRRCMIEVGDRRFVRFLKATNPRASGDSWTRWRDMENGQITAKVMPLVCTNVNVSALARRLRHLAE